MFTGARNALYYPNLKKNIEKNIYKKKKIK